MNKEELSYKKLNTSEKRPGVLGVLEGVCADTINPTRNGRRYSNALWEKVFKDPIVKEHFENGGIFGELGHPTDRDETDMTKIAICMPQPPVKNKDGQLTGRWDILDTPNGRILKTLCDYGFRTGISSRGSGDTYEDYDGQESVDEDTYHFEAFDAVILPAVPTARLNLVESLQDGKTFKKALNEALDRATEDERKIMKETLDNLEIDYAQTEKEDYEPAKEVSAETDKQDNNKEVLLSGDVTAEDAGAELLTELQESLKAQSELEDTVKSLQEKLSVCYTKETRYATTLTKTKNELSRVSSENKNLVEQVEALKQQLAEKDKSLSESVEKVASMRTTMKSARTKMSSLTESVTAKTSEVQQLTESIKTLKEQHTKRCNELEASNRQLQESLADAQKDSKIIKSQANAKITKANELLEKYKAIAKTAVDKYISSQATRLGVGVDQIKTRLNENYSFSDIDRVCDELQQYKLAVNSLPFDIQQRKRPVKMSIKESKETIVPKQDDSHLVDDDVDETLRSLM